MSGGNNSLEEWLNAADKSVVFNIIKPAGIIDTFPKAEHPLLAAATIKTDLRLLIKFLKVDLNKVPAGKRKDSAQSYKTAAKTWLLLHRAGTPGPIRKVQVWWRALVATATQHVLQCLTELNLLDKHEKRLYSGHGQQVGPVSMTIYDAAKLKLHSLVHTLVADDPLSPSEDEEDVISRYCRTQMGLSRAPTSTDKLQEYNRMQQDTKRSLARFREILNHTILWFSTLFCHRETLEHMKNLHSAHVRKNSTLEDDADPEIFTADSTLYRYLLNECSVDNEDLIRGLKNSVEKLVRKRKLTPLRWLREIVPKIQEINDLSTVPLTQAEETKLWKKTWGKNLNVEEIQALLTWKEINDYPDDKWNQIRRFRDGDFDTLVMEEFLTLTQQEFKANYEPEDAVLKYNREHYQSVLHLDPSEISYSPASTKPVEKASKQAPQPSKKSRPPKEQTLRKRKVPELKRTRPAKLLQGATLPPHLRCSNQYCIDKGYDVNHTFANCRSKHKKVGGNSSYNHMSASNTATSQRASAHSPYAKPRDSPSHYGKGRGKGKGKGKGKRPPCRHCGGYCKPGQCPVLNNRNSHNKNVTDRLHSAPGVQARFQKSFYTPELKTLASTVVAGYDLPSVCLSA